MCGIFGIYNLKQHKQFQQDKVEKALATMQHRGPDAQAYHQFNDKAVLGHLLNFESLYSAQGIQLLHNEISRIRHGVHI